LYGSDVKRWWKEKKELVHALGNICNLKHLLIIADFLPIRACLDVWCSVPASFIHLQSFYGKFGFSPWFSRVPGSIGQHHSLYDLKLDVQDVYEDDLRVLSQLPSLVRLHLQSTGLLKTRSSSVEEDSLFSSILQLVVLGYHTYISMHRDGTGMVVCLLASSNYPASWKSSET
jgi:hypothetical protein